MSSAGGPSTGGPGGQKQGSTGVDWDSVLNLTMMDIRTKVAQSTSSGKHS